MNRRGFLTILGALPIFASMPAVALEIARAPRTVKELAKAVEGLYAHVDPTGSVRAFEEFAVISGTGDAPAYRVRHATWAKRGHSELELVRAAWRDVVRGSEGFEGGTLIWRKKPLYTVERTFEGDGDVEKRLRFRFGVLPANWQQLARLTEPSVYPLPGWRGSFMKLEGQPTPWVS